MHHDTVKDGAKHRVPLIVAKAVPARTEATSRVEPFEGRAASRLRNARPELLDLVLNPPTCSDPFASADISVGEDFSQNHQSFLENRQFGNGLVGFGKC